jgi:tetratricopeptide (TPR) repeat protein
MRHPIKFKLLLLAFLCMNGFQTIAQKNRNFEKSEFKRIQLQVYRNAVNCGDFESAIVAMNYLLATDIDSVKYKDSLAYLYYSANKYYQALHWSEQALSNDPNNIGMLEIKGSSLKHTNQNLLAIETFEKLMKLNATPIYASHLIELQYKMKRLNECFVTTKKAEEMNYTNEMIYRYSIEDGMFQETFLKASVFNYQGLVLYELGKKEAALKSFYRALEIDSTFVLAKANVEIVLQELSSQSESNETLPFENSKLDLIHGKE